MMALPQTGSDTGIRTQDLRGYEPDEDDLSSISQQIGAGAHLLLSGFTRDYPDENRPSKGFLKGSGRFNYPACLSYKLVERRGFEPLMFTLWERIYSPLQHRRRCRLSNKANHIAHKIQNLVCPEGFEPSTTWFQTKYATRLRYGQRLPVTLSGVSTRDFRHSN